MPTVEMAPATANRMAATRAPCLKPAKSTVLTPFPSLASPRETITPVSAIAIRPAIRETALLTAEPMPLCAGSTAARIAAVSGDTVIDSPSPNTTMPGRIWVQKLNGSRAIIIHR